MTSRPLLPSEIAKREFELAAREAMERRSIFDEELDGIRDLVGFPYRTSGPIGSDQNVAFSQRTKPRNKAKRSRGRL